MKVTSVKPYMDARDKTSQVREMFDNIAPAYDRLNRTMSFRRDKAWRRKAVRAVKNTGARQITDIATGTADFAISLAKEIDGSTITGLDLSPGMIEIGKQKVERASLSDRITLHVGDCLDCPLPAESADAVTVAFGVRNFADLDKGFRAIRQLLRPGGMVCVLELSEPRNRLVRPFYHLYSRHLIPALGRLMSKDRRAYAYLPQSIEAVPQGREMTKIMEEAGFVNPLYRSLTFGVCTLYTAYCPKK